MHPIVSEHLARAHGDDLLREAATARRLAAARSRGAGAARPTASPPQLSGLRLAVGRRLVAAGTRLAGSGAVAGGTAPAPPGVPCP